jgi:hypothetical protein
MPDSFCRAAKLKEDAIMEATEQCQYVWLQFEKIGEIFMVNRTTAYGRRASGRPIPLGSWAEVSTKLEQAGFSRDRIRVLRDRLEDHAVAIVGPENMSVEQLAVLDIGQTA